MIFSFINKSAICHANRHQLVHIKTKSNTVKPFQNTFDTPTGFKGGFGDLLN